MRHTRILLAAGSLWLAAGAFEASAQTHAELKRAVEAENWPAARKTAKALMAKDPKDAKPYYYLGQVQLQVSSADSAEMTFQRGISVNDKEALNYIGLGQVQFQRNKPVEAAAQLDKAISFSKSKDPNVLLLAARTYLEATPPQPDKAVALLNQAAALRPNNAETHLLLGDAFFLKNVGGQAVSNYNKAATLDPKLAQAHMKIGKIWAQSQNFEESVKSLQKAIAIDTTFAPAYRELGELYYQANQLDNATKAYRNYVRLSNNDVQARARYAGFLYLKKDYPATISLANEVLAQDPNNSIALRVKGYAQYETGDYAGAMQTLDKYFSTVPKEKYLASDYEYYGKAQLETGKSAEAMASFDRALAIDSTKTGFYGDVAKSCLKKKDYKCATRFYRKKIKANNNVTLQDYFEMGQALYLDKQYLAADSAFALIVEKQPDLTLGYQWRARAKAGLDPETTKGLAKENYEQVIEKGTPDVEKNRKALAEAYEYLGYYYVVKKDNAKAKAMYQKLGEVDPGNAKAKEALKNL